MVRVVEVGGKASRPEGQGFGETRGSEGCKETDGEGCSRFYLRVRAFGSTSKRREYLPRDRAGEDVKAGTGTPSFCVGWWQDFDHAC